MSLPLQEHIAGAQSALLAGELGISQACLGRCLRQLRALPLLPDQVQLTIDLAITMEHVYTCTDGHCREAELSKGIALASRVAAKVTLEDRARAYQHGRAALENMQAMATALRDLPIEAKEPLLAEADRLLNGWYTLIQQVNPPGPHADAVYTKMRREAQR